jgi:hypothetical protein
MRTLSPQEKATFDSDGVVLIKQAIEPHWVPRIIDAVDAALAVEVEGIPEAARQFGLTQNLHPTNPEFNTFLHELGLAQLAAEATDSQTIRAYFDQVFMKAGEAGQKVFDWHQDAPYWPIAGDTVVSTWLALTANTVESSALEFVKGSHRMDTVYRPVAGDGSRETMNNLWDGFGDMAHAIPDTVFAFEDEPDHYEIVSYPVEPGDVLLFDYRILHRSRGNNSPNRRIAVSWRWLGDRARWAWERGKDPIINQSHTFLSPGDLITDDETFPIVFQRQAATTTPA